jgi:hypothetical protein
MATHIILQGSSPKPGFSRFGLFTLHALRPASWTFEAIPGFVVFVWASCFQGPEAGMKPKQTLPKKAAAGFCCRKAGFLKAICWKS